MVFFFLSRGNGFVMVEDITRGERGGKKQEKKACFEALSVFLESSNPAVHNNTYDNPVVGCN